MTGNDWLNLYQGKVLGLQTLKERLTDTLRNEQTRVHTDIFGAGGMLTTRATFTIATDEITLSADGIGWTPDGHRLNLDASEAEWQDIPFQNTTAIQYDIGIRWNDVPVVAERGVDGLPHFSYFQEKVAYILNPATVAADGGGGLDLDLTSVLPAGMKFTTSTETRPVIVWYEDANGDPHVSDSTAVENAVLEKDGSDYKVITAGKFGQGASFSTTVARYKIAILGPIPFRSSELPANWATEWLHLGSITTGVYSNALAPLVNNFGSTIVAFNMQHHNTTGVHLDVTADSVEVGSPGGSLPSMATGDVHAQNVRADAMEIYQDTNSLNIYDSGGTKKISFHADPGSGVDGKIRFDDPGIEVQIAINRSSTGGISLTNENGTNDALLYVDGRIIKRSSKPADFALEANDGSDETLYLRNTGAGDLHVIMSGGDLTVSTGDIEATAGDVSGATLSNVASSWDVDASGNVTGNTADYTTYTGTTYTYDSPLKTFTEELSPYMGGWVQEGDTGTVRLDYISGTPAYVSPNASGTDLYLRRPLGPANWARSSDQPTLNIAEINFRYVRVNTGDIVTIRLMRALRDGSGAPVTLNTLNPSTTASFALSSNIIGHAVDFDYHYWLELDMKGNGDSRIANLQVVYTKDQIE